MKIHKEFRDVTLIITLDPWEAAVVKNALKFWEAATGNLTQGELEFRMPECHDVVVEIIKKIARFDNQIGYEV